MQATEGGGVAGAGHSGHEKNSLGDHVNMVSGRP